MGHIVVKEQLLLWDYSRADTLCVRCTGRRSNRELIRHAALRLVRDLVDVVRSLIRGNRRHSSNRNEWRLTVNIVHAGHRSVHSLLLIEVRDLASSVDSVVLLLSRNNTFLNARAQRPIRVLPRRVFRHFLTCWTLSLNIVNHHHWILVLWCFHCLNLDSASTGWRSNRAMCTLLSARLLCINSLILSCHLT